MTMQRIDGITVTMAEERDTVVAQIRKNLLRKLPEAHQLDEWREAMPIALVGGGPSLKDNLKELRQYKNIMVCGSAHDYAVANRIKPRWCVICDPSAIMAKYLKRPSPGCTYLVASQCHADVFYALRHHKIVLWHCGGNHADNSDIWGKENTVLVGGGCTVGTRAIFLAITFGYHNIHLYGYDTCVTEHHHAYEFQTQKEADDLGELVEISLGGPDGTKFRMATYMIGQLFDFKRLVGLFSHRAKFTVHGGGALAELLRLGANEALRLRAVA